MLTVNAVIAAVEHAGYGAELAGSQSGQRKK